MASLTDLKVLYEILKKRIKITSFTLHTMKPFVNLIRRIGVDLNIKKIFTHFYTLKNLNF